MSSRGKGSSAVLSARGLTKIYPLSRSPRMLAPLIHPGSDRWTVYREAELTEGLR